MRTQYYAIYPRNFENEYFIVKITNETELKKLEYYKENRVLENGSVDRVTLKEISHMRASEAEARKCNPASSGFCDPWDLRSIDELVDDDEIED